MSGASGLHMHCTGFPNSYHVIVCQPNVQKMLKVLISFRAGQRYRGRPFHYVLQNSIIFAEYVMG